MNSVKLNNPWLDLPEVQPFTAPCDQALLASDSYDSRGLRFDAFPEPFIGDPIKSKVVLLALNPGFIEHDVSFNMTSAAFMNDSRKNLAHQSGAPFFYLQQSQSQTGGHAWWMKKLNPLVRDGVRIEDLQEKVMCIEYFPYHSVKYHHNEQILPSQQYSFQLLRDAMAANKIVIVMRSLAYWLDAVPELAAYPYAILNSPQNVSVSRNNLQNERSPKDIYMKLLTVLKD